MIKIVESRIQTRLTEPRRALQPKGTQWFPRIGLFVVQAIILGPCRRPISRVSNIESDNSQKVALKNYNNISDGIFPYFTTPSIKITIG